MAERAIRRMTIDEFLSWDDGTDTRYELIDGVVVAMAPAAPRHGNLILRLGGAIEAALAARPECSAVAEAGIVRPDRNDAFYIADIGVSCDPSDQDSAYLRRPVLIVEILSPSTRSFDRNRKVADYQAIPSVQEIVLLDLQRMFAEVLRRDGDGWATEVAQGPDGILTMRSIPLSVAMATLYRGARTAGQK